MYNPLQEPSFWLAFSAGKQAGKGSSEIQKIGGSGFMSR
jgi:hypothetical protein